MTVIEAFAKNVRIALVEIGWSQKELSERSGISVATISGMLCAHNGPSLHTAYNIAKTLGKPLDALTKGVDE